MQEKQSKSLEQSELREIRNRALVVEPSLRAAFQSAFQNWRVEWFTGPAARQSDTRTNRELPTYPKLVLMGEKVLPLVAEQLSDPENFPALVLYDDIARSGEFAASVVEGFVVDGEQSRARRTLRRFLELCQ